MDRRVKYTKQIIRETFLELMEKKDVSKITVTEICNIADINRATFYKYYYDVFDLLGQIENEFIDKIKESLNIELESKNLEQLIHEIMIIVEKDKDLCAVLLSENSNKEFLLSILYYAREQCTSIWGKYFKNIDDDTLNYLFMYNANGIISVIQLWVKNNCPESPEEITKIIIKLVNKGNFGFMI